MDPNKILTPEEVRRVIVHLKESRKSNSSIRLAIFRLACCCGLRRAEISGLDIYDLELSGPYPCINVRKEITKGKRKSRKVPLWWDDETREDLFVYKTLRVLEAEGNGPFVASINARSIGKRLTPPNIANHWDRTLKDALGEERARMVSVHCGRHTFASLAHRAGISLANIRDALGHSSVSITDIYLQAFDDGKRNIFQLRTGSCED